MGNLDAECAAIREQEAVADFSVKKKLGRKAAGTDVGGELF